MGVLAGRVGSGEGVAVGVGVGGSLVSAKLVDEGRFDEITATAKAYVEALAR